MTVHFIGAGPGAPDLITLRAQALIARCPICLYAGALVPAAVLEHCPSGAELIDSQHLDLDAIVAVCAEAHADGRDVARLQSGDLSIYSAVAEQARRLDALGIPWDMTPGVSAYAASAAALGRELTVPEVAQTVILTRHSARASKLPAGEQLAGLAAHGATLVIHLGAQAIAEICATLTAHYGPDCPAAVVAHASRPEQQIIRGSLATLAAATTAAGIRRSATIIVGPALGAEGFADSHLYSAARQSAPGGVAGPE
ncbi:precorrin-4 C(11)-methyltransferase [Conexibacter sp. DBS9H8]|uniref:precorrin-4 C(11)-methyltransferase n=1 Tax=Conexibacter sp. DBS9H8 TaxID=2937801 RepID=UPI00200D34D6|nr:precorrin-4 C(11)-methyltransferase [Conexibacter sp. DBS9H8]